MATYPSFYSVYPDEGTVISDGSYVEIRFIVETKGSGYIPNYVSVRIDRGNMVTDLQPSSSTGGYCYYSYKTPISEGKHEIEYYAEFEGNSTSKICYFQVGQPKPFEIALGSPQAGETIHGNSVNIMFTVTGDKKDIDISKAVISFDSGYPIYGNDSRVNAEELTNGYRFSYTKTGVEDGAHHIIYGLENIETKRVDFTVVNTPLQLIIDSPKNGSVLDNNTVTVLFRASGQRDLMDLASVSISVDGGYPYMDPSRMDTDDGYVFTKTLEIEDGQRTITVGMNYNGVWHTAETTFTVDTVLPPVLTISKPVEGDVIKKKTLEIEGHTNEKCTVYFRLNGIPSGTITTVGQKTFLHTVELAKGANVLVIEATNTGGKTVTETRHITFEPVVPRITDIRITPNPCEAGQEFEIIAEVEYEEV